MNENLFIYTNPNLGLNVLEKVVFRSEFRWFPECSPSRTSEC